MGGEKPYQDRKEIDKYSHRATPDEIQDNEYNLNIPRYVDTFEEEPEINIEEVAGEIQTFAKEEEKLHRKIAGFCKELGIETPF